MNPTVDQAPVHAWLEAFRRAWETDAEPDVAALWSDDAVYFASPFAEPWVGRDHIVREWIALGESDLDWEFEYTVEVDDPDASVVAVHVTYPPDTVRGFSSATEYRNLWLVRFDAEGRAREFTEYWVSKP